MRRPILAARWLSVALALVLVLGTFGHALAYRDRIQPGVRALDLDLGGLSESEARERLAAHLESLARRPGGWPALRVDGAEVPLPAGAFGEPSVLASQVSAAAARAGRDTPLGPLAGIFRQAGLSGALPALPPPAADAGALRRALETLAPQVDRPATEPHITVEVPAPPAPTPTVVAAGGRVAVPASAARPTASPAPVMPRLTVVPGAAGKRLDVERTAADLIAGFSPGSSRAVDATFAPVLPAVPDAQAEAAAKQAADALVRPLTVMVPGVAGRTWTLDRPATVVERVDLSLSGGSLRLQGTLRAEAFDAWAAPLLQTGARPAQDARLEVRGDEIVVVNDVPGLGVDPAALRAAVTAGLFAENRRLELATGPLAARVTAASLAAARDAANRAIAEPLVLTRGERTWTLNRGDLARLLAPPAAPDAPVRFDETKLRARLEEIGKASDRPARSPRLEVRDGQIATLPGEEGEGLDITAATEALQAALAGTGAARTVALATRATTSELPEAKLEAARAQAQRIIGGPLAARHGAGASAKTWTIPQADLPAMLLFGESVNGIVPYLSRDKLVERLRTIAEELDPQLERNHTEALAAWEKREAEREAERTAIAAEAAAAAAVAQREAEEAARTAAAAAAQDGALAAAPTATPAATPAANPFTARLDAIKSAAARDPKPLRRWVDVPATASALWVQAAGATATGPSTRTADVKLTTDDPAKAQTLAQARPGANAPTGAPATAAASAAGAPAKWIDVNLTTQSLVAYEGDWPVFSAMVSTGLPRTPTPPGTFKVFSKLVADDMRGGSVAAGDYYFLPQVPYVMYFLEGGYALHGTYWHSNFGNPMSRGCVNLTPQEAKWLFDWAPLGTTVVVHA
jgi:lipoprotein-anchoring transpeptidase ErfK/SrfK/vancomycin resistance protein YoaR